MATAKGVDCQLGKIRSRQSGSVLQPLLWPSGEPFSSVTCSVWDLRIDRGLQFSLLLTINLHKQSIPTKNSSKASMTGNIQSMKWMLIAWQSSAWKTWNVHYTWSGWMLQRKGEIKMWLEYIFLFLHMCVQEKGNEPSQWIRCINTAAIILSHFKIYFYSVAPFHSFPYTFICKITARAI